MNDRYVKLESEKTPTVQDILKSVLRENEEYRHAMLIAYNYLKLATPRTRNGPCIRAMATIKGVLPEADNASPDSQG